MAPKSLFAQAAQDAAQFLSRDAARRLTDRIISFSKADSIRVNITSGVTGNTRRCSLG